ncbi:hypothetical protein CFP56_021598 [Quercus suber]|uniref:Uncharacterized protein n=1 Tax=Quercus suber TaxID=58331 RepID=A0AAW0LZ97_QUESU
MSLSKGLLGLSAQANSSEDLSSYINNFWVSKLAPLWTFIQSNVTTTISLNQMSGPILLQLGNLSSLVELYLVVQFLQLLVFWLVSLILIYIQIKSAVPSLLKYII